MVTERKAQKAVLFTTDYGFLIPTVVAALQVSAHVKSDVNVDILIFLVDFLEEELNELNYNFSTNGIKFIKIDSSMYDDPNSYYHSSHIPRSALARLCLGEKIPAQYESLIYFDGDVQIVGDISPLLKWEVRPGYILAGLDQGLLEDGEPRSTTSKWYASYTSGLGLKKSLEYFNSGVFALRRSVLLDMGPAALRYFKENSKKCIQHDQSALNAVFASRREYLSPRYNFMPKFLEIGGGDIVKPIIIHFADRNKPWHDPVTPWMTAYAPVYQETVQKHVVLQKYVQYMSTQPKSAPYVPGLLKSAALLLFWPLRRLARRRKLKAYMSQTPFAFK